MKGITMSQKSIETFSINEIGKKNKKLTFRVEDKLLEEFKLLCKEKNITQTAILTNVLLESIKRLKNA